MRWLALIVLAVLAVPASARAQDQATVVASCGTAHLTAGTQAFRTVNVNGVTCSGAGSVVATSVWSATDAAVNGMTLSNGGLTVTAGPGAYQSVRGTNGQTTGKFYVEFAMTGGAVSAGQGDPEFGLASSSFTPTSYLGTSNYSMGFFSGATGAFADQFMNIGAPSSSFTSNYTVGGVYPHVNDVWALAVDLTTGKIWLAQNNVWFGSGNPGAAANPMGTFIAPLLGQAFFPAMTLRVGPADTGVWTLQPTVASQKYAPPAGFSPWN